MDADDSATTVYGEQFWDRHANPKSGWSRLLAYPVLMAALYFRKWLLFGLTAVFVALNPVLFSEPDEPPTDDWMYRVVRAEEFWLSEDHSVLGVGYPQVLNVFSGVSSAYALFAAVKRKPVGTALGTLATMALKLWFVRELVAHHDAARADH